MFQVQLFESPEINKLIFNLIISHTATIISHKYLNFCDFNSYFDIYMSFKNIIWTDELCQTPLPYNSPLSNIARCCGPLTKLVYKSQENLFIVLDIKAC